jgi:nitrate reductase NapE component
MKELKGSWLVGIILIIAGMVSFYNSIEISEKIKELITVFLLVIYGIWNILTGIASIGQYKDFVKTGSKITIPYFVKYYTHDNWYPALTAITYWLILGIFIVKIWLDNNLTIKFIKDGD